MATWTEPQAGDRTIRPTFCGACCFQMEAGEGVSTNAGDKHVPSVSGFLRPASRGDTVRRAFLAGLDGEDGIAAAIPEPS